VETSAATRLTTEVKGEREEDEVDCATDDDSSAANDSSSFFCPASSAQAAPAARAAAPDLPTPVRLWEPLRASQRIVIDPSSPVAPVTIADGEEEDDDDDKREEDQRRRPSSLSSSTSTRTSAAQDPPPATRAPCGERNSSGRRMVGAANAFSPVLLFSARRGSREMTEAETPSSAAATRESAPAEEALEAAARERELQQKLSEPAATTVASTSREPLVTTSSRSCPRWSAVEGEEEEKEEDEGEG
jgi:hypothetical protein